MILILEGILAWPIRRTRSQEEQLKGVGRGAFRWVGMGRYCGLFGQCGFQQAPGKKRNCADRGHFQEMSPTWVLRIAMHRLGRELELIVLLFILDHFI